MKNKRYFISIVSHGHMKFISENRNLKKINSLENVIVAVKDNVADTALERYCIESGLEYIQSAKQVGFGENNNEVFEYLDNKYEIKADDFFLVVNPDVLISQEEFIKLVSILSEAKQGVYTVNLFSDVSLQTPEQSLRRFPSFLSALNMFIAKPVCKSYDKAVLNQFDRVEWASGAFLIFSASIYRKLEGFDVGYFMYYEDVDICHRYTKITGQMVHFLKNINAVHEGAYKNRDVFSKHFYWYLKSLFRFLIRK